MINEKLLSLVLGYPVEILEDRGNEILTKTVTSLPAGSALEQQNKDTLCRLYKEWCYDNGYPLTIIYANNIVHVRFMLNGEQKRFYGKAKDELNTVIAATEWVAKEKGL